jgi:nitroreductase
MEVKDLILERRSIQAFEDREVPFALVTELLETAIWVPNHRMTQPWRFILVHGDGRPVLLEAARRFAEKAEKDATRKKDAGERQVDKLKGVPFFLLVVMAENPHPLIRDEDYAATSCIVQNLSLLAWDKGLGMVWKTYGMIHDPGFREALGVEAGERVVASLHIGYPLRFPNPQPRIPAAVRITTLNG